MMSKSSISLLAKAVANKRGLTQAEAERFIAKMFEVVQVGLDEDKLVKMKWLGTFKVTAVKDRESVDVNTGERILIEGRDKISFTPDSIIKEIINKPFEQFETVMVNDGVDFSDIDEKFAKMSNEKALETYDGVEQVKKISCEINQAKENTDEVSPVVNFFLEGNDGSCAEEGCKPSDEVVVISDEFGKKVIHVNSDEAESQEQLESEETSIEETPALGKYHFDIPKYAIVIASVVILCLIGGFGWFAFNYGIMQAQRGMYANEFQGSMTRKANIHPTASAPLMSKFPVKSLEDSVQTALRKRATKDKVRMAAARKVIVKVEQERKTRDSTAMVRSAQKYDYDPRVRTGGYRIVGVATTVTVKNGETLSSIAKRYLGLGMECYVEAINGVKQVKAGQRIKIPKLELKRKYKNK